MIRLKIRARATVLTAAFALLVCTCACSQTVSDTGIGDSYDNFIAEAELSGEENAFLEFIGISEDVSIFAFSLDEPADRFLVWVEEYRDGEKAGIDDPVAIELSDTTGEVALVKNADGGLTVSIKSGDEIKHKVYSLAGNEKEYIENGFGEYFSGSSQVGGPVEIEPDSEITLFVVWEDGEELSQISLTEASEVPETYDYGYIVKCRFS